MTRNGQFHLIHNFSNLFPPKWSRITRNGQFCLIHNFSNLFPPKWLRMTQNGQLCLIRNFSNFFPPKWPRMTRNGQLCMAKIKYTLIQGNFYERLLFYMDSCALSPTASLLSMVHRLHVSTITRCVPYLVRDSSQQGSNPILGDDPHILGYHLVLTVTCIMITCIF